MQTTRSPWWWLLNIWQTEQAYRERYLTWLMNNPSTGFSVFKTAIGTLAVAFWVNEELISLLGVAEPSFGHNVIKGLTGLIRVPWPSSLYLLALLCSICLRGFACICVCVCGVCVPWNLYPSADSSWRFLQRASRLLQVGEKGNSCHAWQGFLLLLLVTAIVSLLNFLLPLSKFFFHPFDTVF